ncbi:S8 family peptidase [Bacteriovoracaceae bacterium]|nr:S8 family peptidase [Bacteriovoracaceae bacterium]
MTMNRKYFLILINLLMLITHECFGSTKKRYLILTDNQSSQKSVTGVNITPKFKFDIEFEYLLEKSTPVSKSNTIGQSSVASQSIIIALLTDTEQANVSTLNNVIYIEEDSAIWMGEQYRQMVTNQWGLDRIDSTQGLDGYFNYQHTGKDVDIYIVDSGVRGDHQEFQERVLIGKNFFDEKMNGNTDCQGHGTHVAGTTAGSNFGVAKKATIIPATVLGCDGRGYISTLLRAIKWIKTRSVERLPRKSVANFSISASKSEILNIAIKDLVSNGVSAVVAAGNAYGDACLYSPSSEGTAITVGAINMDDSIASFSNKGSCVDLFAPGVDIQSASYLSSSMTTKKSGTSMAAPHVTGVVALILEQYPNFTPKQISNHLVNSASFPKPVVDFDCRGSIEPNRILKTSHLSDDGAPWEVDLSGSRYEGKFPFWNNLMTGKNKDICFQFEATIVKTNNNANPDNAPLLVGLSTHILPIDFDSYRKTNFECKVPINLYRFDIRNTSQRSFQNASINRYTEKKLDDIFELNQFRSFYVRMETYNDKFIFVVGKGDEPGVDVLHSFEVPESDNLAPKYFSLSTHSNFDIKTKNIRRCNESLDSTNKTCKWKIVSGGPKRYVGRQCQLPFTFAGKNINRKHFKLPARSDIARPNRFNKFINGEIVRWCPIKGVTYYNRNGRKRKKWGIAKRVCGS